MKSFIIGTRLLQRCKKRFPLHLRVQTQPTSLQQRSIITTPNAAKALLGIKKDIIPTMKEVRYAYFEMAKKCHPDVQEEEENDGEQFDFLKLTEAYEFLIHNKSHHRQEGKIVISLEEEETYRQACLAILGLPAEIVEESKRNAMFRFWLAGNTDGAQHWKGFLASHGGLAQRLRPIAGLIEGGEDGAARAPRRRPKR